MGMRGLVGVTVIGSLSLAGCGGASLQRANTAIHLDGKRTQADFVSETDAAGAQFLVPTAVLAAQAKRTFDVEASSAPTVGTAVQVNTITTRTYRWAVSFATAVVPHSGHVEVLATGDAGLRFKLNWEDTCSLARGGDAAGGLGSAILRAPAVVLVKLATKGGGSSCYLAATASTASFTRGLHLAIIDY